MKLSVHWRFRVNGTTEGQSRRSSGTEAYAANAQLGIGIIATGALADARGTSAEVPFDPPEQPDETVVARRRARTPGLTTRLRSLWRGGSASLKARAGMALPRDAAANSAGFYVIELV